MVEEENNGDINITGEVSFASNSVSLRQPREITKSDVEMLLAAYEMFLKMLKGDREPSHFR